MRAHEISLNHNNIQSFHFDTKWENMDEFKGWLKPYARDDQKAFCALCHTIMKADLLDLISHGSSKKHTQMKCQKIKKNQTYEDELLKQSMENGSSEDNYSDDDSANKKWNSLAIECLLKQLKTCWPDFSNSLRDNRDIWQGVSNAMETNGYFYSSTDCEKQFQNMKVSFYNIICKLNMDDQIVSFNLPYFNELHHLLANEPETLQCLEEKQSFSKLITTFKNEKVLEEVNVPTPVSNSHFTFAIEGDAKWTVAAINVFLKLLLSFQDIIKGGNEERNFPLWQSLSTRMSQEGYDFDEDQCRSKWLSMVQKYNNFKDESETTGILPLWPYFTKVRHIISKIKIPSENDSDWTKKLSNDNSILSNKVFQSKVNSNKRRRISDNDRDGDEMLLEEEAIRKKPMRPKYRDHAVNRRIQQLSENAQVWERLDNIENNVHDLACQQEQQALTNSLLEQILIEINTLASYIAPKNTELRDDITLIVPMTGD